jgi:type II secretory pathway pseudopilin PulG
VRPSHTTLARSPGNRTGEAGYNLVILMVAVTVLNILVAAAIPLWRTASKRDKEEELIFRGWQYAEAIRVFQHRYGRLPVRLEELIEVKPRCIRQLWTDPMTGKRDWVLIHVGAPGTGVPTPGNPGNPGDATDPDAPGQGAGPGTGDENGGDQGPGTDPGSFQPGATHDTTIGPIRGVRSRSDGKAIKRLFDADRYDRWLFTVDLLQVSNVSAGGVGVPAPPIREPIKWKGRPFRDGLNPGGAPVPGIPGQPVPTPGTRGIPGGTGQPKPEPPAPQLPLPPGGNDGGA